MIKIILADDHSIVRYIIKRFISEEEDLMVCGEAENGKQVLEMLKDNVFDLLILDLNLPDMNGLELINKMKDLNLITPVLILSVCPEEQFAVNAIKAGASGYLNKLNTSENLITAIKKILMGGYYISPNLCDNLVTIINHTNSYNYNRN